MIDEKINIKIKQIFNGSYTAQVYFVLRKQDEFVIKLADIEDKDEPELREMFSSELIKNIVNDENLKYAYYHLLMSILMQFIYMIMILTLKNWGYLRILILIQLFIMINSILMKIDYLIYLVI